MICLAAALLLAAFASRASAEEDAKAELHRLYDEGANAFADGRYAVAVNAFEKAYRLKPAGATLYNIARAYDRQFIVDNDDRALKRAIETYREYLGDEKPTRRQEAVERLEALTYIQARRTPLPQQQPSYATPMPYQAPTYPQPIYLPQGKTTDSHGLIEPWPVGRDVPPPVIVQPPDAKPRSATSAPSVAPAPATPAPAPAMSAAERRREEAIARRRDEAPTLLPADDDEVPDPDRVPKSKPKTASKPASSTVASNPNAGGLKWVPAKTFLEGAR